MPRIDLTGARFGHLSVVAYGGQYGHDTLWLCRCDCGNEKKIRSGVLRRGEANGCGCLRSRSHLIHGRTRTKEHVAWSNAKQRCFDPNVRNFGDYGGRGITMCPEWRDSFAAFLRDMGPCPDDCSLDRINNDGNYEPGNCRWATRQQQTRNRRNAITVMIDGMQVSLAEAAAARGLRYGTVTRRLRLGWTTERALSALD